MKEYLKKLEDEVTTQQQETALESYRKHVEEVGGDAIPFWAWYRIWCSEENVFNDSASYQRDRDCDEDGYEEDAS